MQDALKEKERYKMEGTSNQKLHQGQNLKECNLLKFLTKLSLIKFGVTYSGGSRNFC
jgi:hypothetical protein